jgi:YhcH/YjgK/YiaL family protein
VRAGGIERLGDCLREDAARAVARFLETLAPETPPGDYPILGRDLYASLARYTTRPREAAYPEAHRDYADIQLLLAGEEEVEWRPVEGLRVRTPYDPERDVEFYERPEDPGKRVTLRPGLFALFLPTDVHTPQLHAGGLPGAVTKVVLKVRSGLLLRGEDRWL